jgi:hypothetical protein
VSFRPAFIATARTIDHWLTVCTALGLLTFGWLCVVANAVHLFARRTDPSWDLLFRSDRAAGIKKTRRDILRHHLGARLRVSQWKPAYLSIGAWTAGGSLLGSSFGMLLGILHL